MVSYRCSTPLFGRFVSVFLLQKFNSSSRFYSICLRSTKIETLEFFRTCSEFSVMDTYRKAFAHHPTWQGTFLPILRRQMSLSFDSSMFQHTYIPVLPFKLVDMCCLPTPYLLGVLSGCLEEIHDLPIDEVPRFTMLFACLRLFYILPFPCVISHGDIDRLVLCLGADSHDLSRSMEPEEESRAYDPKILY